MLTLEELNDKVAREYKGFKLSGIKLTGEYVDYFTISRTVADDVLLFCYFWDSKLSSYISYFI